MSTRHSREAFQTVPDGRLDPERTILDSLEESGEPTNTCPTSTWIYNLCQSFMMTSLAVSPIGLSPEF